MMNHMYHYLLTDLEQGNTSSVIFRHHIDYVNSNAGFYQGPDYLESTEKNQVVVDYIASMTDDYFVDLYEYLFPKSSYKINYVSYFDEKTDRRNN